MYTTKHVTIPSSIIDQEITELLQARLCASLHAVSRETRDKMSPITVLENNVFDSLVSKACGMFHHFVSFSDECMVIFQN